mmetsp:Transcript_31889/g.67044  ORF Transcript_31889/g.67044 Transcript_31889/m.67044 type:complete len:438 (+) Transcript_31889:154-1467(+)
MPAAPSDWDELRAHFQFVLPSTNYDSNNSNGAIINNNSKQYGSTWQERMVKHYHSHLYKEYVLADLSRVLDIGKVGLRWRTEKEVGNGRGFQCCGNLKCESGAAAVENDNTTINTMSANSRDNDRIAYSAAARRHMGIAVPENGGKDPIGVVLPTTSEEVNRSLELYLQSCAEERRCNSMQQQQNSTRGGHMKHSRSQKSRRKRRHHHRHKHDSKLPYQTYSLKEQERNEQKRLSCLPLGTGLHDYEVNFVYVEHGIKKRELVKVRLCLRCAPLLYVAKMKDDFDGKSSNGDEKKAPAIKAREAREKAAWSHAASTANDSVSNSTHANAHDHADGMAEGGEVKEEHSVIHQSDIPEEPKYVSQSKRTRRDDDDSDSSNGGSNSNNNKKNNNHRHRRSHGDHRNGGHGSKKKRRLESSSSSSSSDSKSDSSSSSSLDS